MQGDLEAVVERLRCEHIDEHLTALRSAAAENRQELPSGRLSFGERERLARAILQMELEISRLEQMRTRPQLPAGAATVRLYGSAARD